MSTKCGKMIFKNAFSPTKSIEQQKTYSSQSSRHDRPPFHPFFFFSSQLPLHHCDEQWKCLAADLQHLWLCLQNIQVFQNRIAFISADDGIDKN